MLRKLLAAALLLASVGGASAAPQNGASPSDSPSGDPYLAGLEYRMVGPHRGGRVTTVTGVVGKPHTFYFGGTGGGIWRTEDAGESWENLTDGQIGAGGIGAVAVAPSDPNVLYLGTGSTCVRGNVSPGLGAYRSTDAGKTWQSIGLENAGQIGKMVVHPTNSQVVFAAAMGNAFGPNEERGVFRSTDGGDSWEKVLYLDERTGVVDLSIDPRNPRVLYAGAWGGAERKPWDIRSGSDHGGVYKTTDGGDSWDKLAGGLPEGMVGKVGVAVSPADPDRVFAIVEHEKGGLYRSEDGGETWKLINESHMLWERPWYYSHVIPDPRNANTVWVANVFLQKSEDGGQSFTPVASGHPDYHAIWINPDNTDLMIIGDDGGAEVSLTGGRSWSTIRNQATAELYRVSVDDQFPYRLYGAQQDNSTISVPSRLPPGMASDHEAEFQVGGCESGHIAIDPRNPDIIYAGCYGGSITRLDRKTGLTREIIAYPQLQLAQDRGELKYRYQWNAPIRISPHDPGVLYHTSQFVHRSTDEGHSWQIISPDLTTDNPEHQGYSGGPLTHDGTGVEIYGTIFAFEESALTPGVLWAGSDDGRLHVSRDNGDSWTEVTPAEMPAGATINTIDLSALQDGRAFVSAYRYREADLHPYVYATDDYGASWRSLTDGRNGIPSNHFVRVVREDPDRRGLLYAGTEYGMYISFDDGANWESLQLNLPVTPVTDLQIHHRDLVLSTQGRSFWILDDLTPLYALTDEVRAAAAWLAEPRDAYRLNGTGGFSLPGGRRADDAPGGVIFDYFMGEDTEGPVTLTVADADGTVVRELSSEPPPGPQRPIPEVFLILAETFGLDLVGRLLSTTPGHNRYVWDMSYEAPKLPEGAVIFGWLSGATVLPGTYQATLTAGDETQTRSFEILPDPRGSAPLEDMRAQLEFLRKVEGRLEILGEQVTALRSVRKQAQGAGERVAEVMAATGGATGDPDGDEDAAEEDTRAQKVQDAVQALTEHLTAIEEELLQTKSRSFEDPLNYPGKLTAQLANLHTVVNSGSDSPPTATSVERLADLDDEIEDVYARLQEILDSEVASLNVLVNGIELPAVVLKGD